MRFLSVPFLIFASIILISQSGSKIHIIHADLNQGRKVNNQQLRILKGNVHVLKDTTHMYCDSAYYFEERNTLELFGNVVVDNGHRIIKAKKIIYFSDENLTECIGFVRATSETDSLFTHRLIYNLKNKEAVANDSVFLWSKKDDVYMKGENAFLDEKTSYFRVTENAYLLQIDSTTNDSFQINAKKIEYFGDTERHCASPERQLIFLSDHSLASSAGQSKIGRVLDAGRRPDIIACSRVSCGPS